tara:strand:+ start:1160 stop:1399 length:240 start_codon:yes stop_codon:yes gene_type:complete
MSIFPVLIIIVLLVTIIKLISQNKQLKDSYHALIVDVQSTENIETKSDYQDRSFITNLKRHTIHTDMDDSRSYTIKENK